MKKFIASVLVLLGVVAGTAVMPASTVWAEGEEAEASPNSLQMSPSGVRLTLVAGETLEGHAANCPNTEDGCAIKVANTGTQGFRFRVYVTPYVVSGEDNELTFDEEKATAYTQISRWIKVQNANGEYVDEAEFSLQPGESRVIPYRVAIPKDIPGGSQYAVIWAQIANDTEFKGGIETVGRAGAVITGRTNGDSTEAAEINDIEFTRFAFNGPLRSKATVKNVGNTDFVVKYSYTARTLFGKEMHTSGEQTLAAYPGTEYHISTEWEKTPFMGIFQAEFKINAAGEEKVEKHIVIIMPVFILILLILLLTIIAVWIIIIIRKRKERKARTLV